MNFIEGNFNGENLKIGIVISRFNSAITTELLNGAQDCLLRHGTKDENIDVYFAPGAFELPFLAKQLASSGKYDGIISLACVIRGDTYHFEVVANEVSKGIAHINLESKIPVTLGVLTTDTVEQALNRAGLKSGNKGFDAAMALIEMIDLNKKIPR